MTLSKQNSRFPINRIYISFVILTSSGGLFAIAFFITRQVYHEWASGLPISGDFSWPIVIGIDIACVLGFLAILWKVYRDANTEFGEDYLSKPSIFGRVRIDFSEVTGIQIFGGIGYHILSDKNKIVVSPYAYSNPKAVISTLDEKIRRHRKA